jgi:hypothetical protein
MSCDNPTYHTAFDLDPCLSPRPELGDFAPPRETDLARDKSLKQGRSGRTGDRSKSKAHIIPDSTETVPEYVWGDEGPIND